MAEVNPPAWQEDGTFLAQQDRQALMALMTPSPGAGAWAPMPGIRPSPNSPMGVTAQTSPNMSVKVATGTAFVAASIAINAGWVCTNNGSRTVNIAAADPSHPRVDQVIARVYDATDDVGPSSFWVLEVVQGTPAASPVPAALPANCVPVANVTVGAGATSVTSGNISDRRTWTVALGGILPTVSGALPSAPYPGQAVWCADTGQVLVYQGAASPNPNSWQSPAGGGWGPWTSGQVTNLPWSVAVGTWTLADAEWPPATFTVPPSGSVIVTVTAGFGNAISTSSTASVGFSIKDPLVGPTGPNYVPFAGHNALTVQDIAALRASVRMPVAGLTPGKSLQAHAGCICSATNVSYPADDGNGLLIVEPVL